MEFEKARAKAGAAGVAGERARAEKMAATEKGIGVLAGKSAQATQQLLGVQAGQQAGLATPQVGGVTPTSGLEGAKLQADISKAGATQQMGTRGREDQVTQVQKGVVKPALTSGATGQAPAGTTGGAGGAMNTSPGTRALVGDLSASGGVLQGTRDIGGALMGSLRTAVGGVRNPR